MNQEPDAAARVALDMLTKILASDDIETVVGAVAAAGLMRRDADGVRDRILHSLALRLAVLTAGGRKEAAT